MATQNDNILPLVTLTLSRREMMLEFSMCFFKRERRGGHVKPHHEGRNPQRVFSLPVLASEWILRCVL